MLGVGFAENLPVSSLIPDARADTDCLLLSLAGLWDPHTRLGAAAGLTVGTPAGFPGSSTPRPQIPREVARDLQFGANSVHGRHHSCVLILHTLRFGRYSFLLDSVFGLAKE